ANVYAYSADGALEARLDTGTGERTSYRYDMDGNLLGAVLSNGEALGYVVDAAGRRMGRTLNGDVTHGWLYGSDLGPAAELDATGRVSSRFVYARRSWVLDYMIKDGTVLVLVTDAVGSVRLVVNATTGSIAQRIDYDEFGRVVRDTNPGFQPF